MNGLYDDTSSRPDAGSVSLELVVVAPALLLLVVAIIAGGRLAQARQAVELASAQAARATALAPTPAAGAGAGRIQAASAVAALGLRCRPITTVSAAGLARQAGTPATVSVAVSCRVRLRDVAVPGLPGSVVVSASTVEPVDRWVSR